MRMGQQVRQLSRMVGATAGEAQQLHARVEQNTGVGLELTAHAVQAAEAVTSRCKAVI